MIGPLRSLHKEDVFQKVVSLGGLVDIFNVLQINNSLGLCPVTKCLHTRRMYVTSYKIYIEREG